jgi:hypothetical protein
MAAFCNVTLCILVLMYGRCCGTCYIHRHVGWTRIKTTRNDGLELRLFWFSSTPPNNWVVLESSFSHLGSVSWVRSVPWKFFFCFFPRSFNFVVIVAWEIVIL